jgi:hypothetical protein
MSDPTEEVIEAVEAFIKHVDESYTSILKEFQNFLLKLKQLTDDEEN